MPCSEKQCSGEGVKAQTNFSQYNLSTIYAAQSIANSSNVQHLSAKDFIYS